MTPYQYRLWAIAILFAALISACGSPPITPIGEQPTSTTEPTPLTKPTAEPGVTVEPTNIPATHTPAISEPLSGRVIYGRFDVGQQRGELRSMTLDGSDDRALIAGIAGCELTGLAVSPDGGQISYTLDSCPEAGLYLVDADGSNDRQLMAASIQLGAQAWSPDGTRIAFARLSDAGDAPVPAVTISVIEPARGASIDVVGPSFFITPPAWLDDDQLVFSHAVQGGTPPAGWQTFVSVAQAGWEPERLAAGQLVAVSPDRAALLTLMETRPDSSLPVRLALTEIDSGVSRWLEQQPGPPPLVAWSPNGTFIARHDLEAMTIEVIDRVTGDRQVLRQLKPENVLTVQLAWTPDSGSLVYSAGGPDGTTIYRINVADGSEQPLASLDSPPRFLAVIARRN